MKSLIRRVASRGRRALERIDPFKSQKRQDKWVMFSVLRMKRNGFFLDLAAADGVTHSNTYVLEKLFGWKGVCVEPNPVFLQELKAKRKCFIDGSVVSDRKETVTFRLDNGQLGGIIADDTDNNQQVRSDELAQAETITLEAVTVNEILDKYNAPKTIDYFSLDVEGCEERVIRSLDFSKYEFGCITIERPTPRVNEILFENGYVFVKNFYFDSFYAHPSLVEQRRIRCEPFEQVPPKDW